jgi:hypothetical protein
MLLLVAAFNRVVNPYGLFDGPVIDGVNREKPETNNRQRISKAYQLRYLKPQAIILGTSRANALDARHIHWRNSVAYNLALNGSSIYEQWRYLQHAQAISPLREVVLGMDFFMFNDLTGQNFKEARLAVDAAGHLRTALMNYDAGDLMAGLLSGAAFRSSFKTIKQQGRYTDTNSNRRNNVVAKGGHWGLFTEMERKLFQEYAAQADRADEKQPGNFSHFDNYRNIIRFAHAHDIRLHLFISPSHARMWELWRIVGKAEERDNWKRLLVSINEEEAILAGRKPFPLWDFSGYNSITTEAVPVAEEVERSMVGYWEGSHYKHEVANYVLDRLFSVRDGVRIAPDDFGVFLTGGEIEMHLKREQYAGAQYRNEYHDEVRAMEQLFQYYKKQQAQ